MKILFSAVLTLATASAAASNITVVTPANNSQVSPSFQLTASTSSCGGVPAVSMGYSIDSAVATIEPTAFTALVSASTGAHVLHVKCWGQQTHDEELLDITVVNLPEAATPRFSLPSGKFTSRQVVSISDSTPGAAIYYTTDGSAPSTSSLQYSGPIQLTTSTVVETIATATGYSNSGLGRANYAIVKPAAPSIPADATVDTEVQTMPGWRIKHDPATSGTATGAMSTVSVPSLSGEADQFDTTFTDGGGLLYSMTYGNDSTSMNFVYDAEVWIAQGSQLANLEMDNNQVIANGNTVIYAFQCSGYSGYWEYTSNAGTIDSPIVKWNHSTAACNPADWTTNTWHHVQIEYSRDDSGNVTYQAVWLDGARSSINVTVPSAFSLGWADGSLVTNFQVDGTSGSGWSTLYLDSLTISRW